jgi:hypothetical protein
MLQQQDKQTLCNLCRRHIRAQTSESTFILDVLDTAGCYRMPVFEAVRFCKEFMRRARDIATEELELQ